MLSLDPYTLVLASGSPRRKAFIDALQIPFRVDVRPIQETYPPDLKGAAIAMHIAQKKISPFEKEVLENEIVLTADTVVWHQGNSLAKPQNSTEANKMLHQLSGSMHEVITAVALLHSKGSTVFYETTKVYFKPLSAAEIEFYIKQSPPLDKAGAYGIQDWIGTVGIEKIEGSYTNVVGLPVSLVVEKLKKIVAK